MEKYKILIGYFDKQLQLVNKLHKVVVGIDVGGYEKQFQFALQVQQLYTALEDLFKQIAKAFENHVEDLSRFHKEILVRMNLEIPKMRPAVISNRSLLFLDKLRAFRHFVRHAYDCDLDERQLAVLQKLLRSEFQEVEQELLQFRNYLLKISS